MTALGEEGRGELREGCIVEKEDENENERSNSFRYLR